MKYLHNGKGFTVVETVLVVLLLVAIGAAGYFAYQARHANEAQSPTSNNPTQSKASTQAADPYKGWGVYTSAKSKVSFKYPTDWKESIDNDELTGEGAKIVKLTGPHGLELTYLDALNGVGGGCASDSPHVVITNVQKLNNSPGVYLAENPGTIALSDTIKKTGDLGSCLFYPTVGGDNGMSFASAIEYKPNSESFSTSERADLASARLILLSFTR